MSLSSLLRYGILICFISSNVVTLPAEGADIRTDVVAITGEYSPTVDGLFLSTGTPILDDAGLVAFQATVQAVNLGPFPLPGQQTVRILHGSSAELLEVARTGAAAPDGNGKFLSFPRLSLSMAGDVAFAADLTATADGTDDDEGIFRHDGTSLVQMARGGKPVPGGSGELRNFFDVNVGDSGEVVFMAFLSSPTSNIGVLQSNGTTARTLARVGTASPDGNGVIGSMGLSPTINALGNAAFSVSFSGSSGGENDDSGLALATPAGLSIPLREGRPSPSGDGIINQFSNPVLNDSNTIAVVVSLSGSSQGGDNNAAIIRLEGNVVTEAVREGRFAPNGNGLVNTFSAPAINNMGQIATEVQFRSTLNGIADSRAILVDDGQSLVEVVRSGQIAPEGVGVFTAFSATSLNDAGQLAFKGEMVLPGGGSATGLFLSDPVQGLIELVRTGNSLLGSTIASLELSSGLGSSGQSRRGLNNFGQVAYKFQLADGRSGIAVLTQVPEPSTMLLALLGLLALRGRGRQFIR